MYKQNQHKKDIKNYIKWTNYQKQKRNKVTSMQKCAIKDD